MLGRSTSNFPLRLSNFSTSNFSNNVHTSCLKKYAMIMIKTMFDPLLPDIDSVCWNLPAIRILHMPRMPSRACL